MPDSVLGGPGDPVAPVKAATGGLLNLTSKFLIPIASFGVGFATGSPVATGIGDFILRFVPGMGRIAEWVNSREGSIWIGMIIGAAVLLSVGISIAWAIKSFFGGGVISEMMFRGIIGYVVGASVSAMLKGFGPAKKALDQAGG